MAVTGCLTESDLRRLFEGGPSDDRLRLHEEHVLVCAACLGRLQKLMATSGDNWPVPSPSEAAPSADDLIARLDAMRPVDATGAPDTTPGDPTDAASFVPPTRLGPFEIGELLGAGGVGMVFAAIDTELHRPVAIKVLRPEHARNPIAHRRFLEEARAIAALPHDHIVPIFRVGEESGMPFLAMPRLEGQSLADELRSGCKLSVADAIDVARQVTLALAAAHERGIIHRDIKPGNLWREPNGRMRVLDFGLARFIASDTRLTQTGLIIGTPAYMAPEQADGDHVDHRCDLFSLGCVVYQMMSGRVPFPGTTPYAVFKAMAAGDAEPLAKIDPAVPERLSILVARLLQRDPAKRPATAAEVLQELNAAHAPVARPWYRRRVLQTIGGAIVGAVGFVGWSLLSRRAHERRELYLHPTGSAWVRSGLMDPEKTCTIECWFTAMQQFDDATHIIGNTSFLIFGGKGDEGSNVYHLSVYLRKGTADQPVDERIHFRGDGTFTPGRRMHLAIVNNNIDFRMFLDGKLSAARPLRPYLSLVPTNSFLLGAVNSAIGMRYEMVRVSSIARYFDSFTPAEVYEPDDHTTALYRCDEDSGKILTDCSGRENHGTVHGPFEWAANPPAP